MRFRGNLFFIASCILLTIISCESLITRTNDEKDMNQAKQYVGHFYSLIQQQDFEQASKLFDTNISPTEGLKMIRGLRGMRGEIIDAVTDKVGTKVVTTNGTVTHVQYSVELNCVYEQGKTRETLVIEGGNFESLQIVGYHFELQ